MPYLQLEVTKSYPLATKQQLAKKMGGVWRCSEDEPSQAAIWSKHCV
nr:hypothetical protein [Mucilaginibacter sp. X5P1]